MPQKNGKPRVRRPWPAFIVTLLTGLFFTAFGIAESAFGGDDPAFRYGGLMEALTFGVSFLLVAGILWTRPRLGGFLLMLLGVAFGVWMVFGWNIGAVTLSVAVPLVGLPILLGFITLFGTGMFRRHATMADRAAK